MRRVIIVLVGGVVGMGLLISTPPIHSLLFPRPLTANQRAILSRAEAGLRLFATKSPTAASFFRDARKDSWWSRTPIVFSAPAEVENRPAPYAVSVMSSNPMKLVAFYFHPTRAICFVEEACDSLGYLALGLTYAHELQHRRDFHRGLVTNRDVLNSQPAQLSEARSKLTELKILNEYTEGRWLTAVDNHRRMYRQQSARIRRRFPLGRRAFDTDIAWIREEFGQAGQIDRRSLRDYLLYTAKFREATANRALSTDDSLRVAAETFYAK